MGPSAHFCSQCQPVSAADVHFQKGAGHCVEAGGEDDDVELEVLLGRSYARGCDLLNGRAPQVDEMDVVAVVGLEVVGVEQGPLGAEGVVVGEELAAGLGVVDCLADLGADEVGGRVVCGLVRHEVGERSADEVEAALGPLLLIQLVALSLGVVQGGTLHRVQMAAAVAPACLLEDCLVVRFDLFLDEPTVRRPVAGGHGELGRALEDREAAGLPGDDWNRLHAAGAGAYDRHAFSRKVDGVVRPGAGVVPVALEGLQPLDPGDVARGYAADAGDEVPGGYPVAVVGLDLPQVGFFAEGGGRDAGVELDVATQVEAVGDVVEVGEDLRLLGVFAAPAPVLEQLASRTRSSRCSSRSRSGRRGSGSSTRCRRRRCRLRRPGRRGPSRPADATASPCPRSRLRLLRRRSQRHSSSQPSDCLLQFQAYAWPARTLQPRAALMYAQWDVREAGGDWDWQVQCPSV